MHFMRGPGCSMTKEFEILLTNKQYDILLVYIKHLFNDREFWLGDCKKGEKIDKKSI